MKVLTKGLLTAFVLLCFQSAFAQPTAGSAEFRSKFLENINHVRETGCNCGTTFMPPAPALVWNNELETAAMGHAKDMAHKNYFSHTSKDGRTMDKRIIAAGFGYKGYKSFAIGENIAQGQMSITEVMDGWFNSPGHCKNLMNPAFKEIGVALYNTYWVQDFGGRESFTAEQQQMLKSGKAKLIEN
ncbi:CAP domain-containing protein [Mucilaginibacter xinganensis]|uniref:SCP domain-containing protein n=1 Tax=Mucilaginibacter xinganensis TaxID=1234841 RepID=A0A223NVK7_9SPHI|nr:CAP domain-containing protein [Mucilaginibacter xinganensis]ASU33919.1 hypothetical protein MuYL_2027 [Mucilaginibacter xinganensis]